MLLQIIRNELEKKNIDLKAISKVTETSPASVSNWLNQKNEICFPTAVRIVKYLFPDKEKERIAEYISFQKKPENLRLSMEYASFHNLNDSLEKLITSQKKSNNLLNREWAKTYELDLLYRLGKMPFKDLINSSNNLKVKSSEMKILKRWLEIRGFHREKIHGYLLYLVEDFYKEIDRFPNNFLKEYFRLRIDMTLCNIYLYNDNIKEFRECAMKVISSNLDDIIVAKLMHGLGISYMLEDYDLSIKHLLKAKRIFEENEHTYQIRNVTRSIIFVSNYWNKICGLGNEIEKEVEDIHEIAHLAIKKGQVQQAQNILLNIDVEKLNNYRQAFHYYFRGLAFNNTDYFYMSLNLFNQCGDKYFGKLPCYELLRAGEKELIIRTAYGKPVAL